MNRFIINILLLLNIVVLCTGEGQYESSSLSSSLQSEDSKTNSSSMNLKILIPLIAVAGLAVVSGSIILTAAMIKYDRMDKMKKAVKKLYPTNGAEEFRQHVVEKVLTKLNTTTPEQFNPAFLAPGFGAGVKYNESVKTVMLNTLTTEFKKITKCNCCKYQASKHESNCAFQDVINKTKHVILNLDEDKLDKMSSDALYNMSLELDPKQNLTVDDIVKKLPTYDCEFPFKKDVYEHPSKFKAYLPNKTTTQRSMGRVATALPEYQPQTQTPPPP